MSEQAIVTTDGTVVEVGSIAFNYYDRAVVKLVRIDSPEPDGSVWGSWVDANGSGRTYCLDGSRVCRYNGAKHDAEAARTAELAQERADVAAKAAAWRAEVDAANAAYEAEQEAIQQVEDAETTEMAAAQAVDNAHAALANARGVFRAATAWRETACTVLDDIRSATAEREEAAADARRAAAATAEEQAPTHTTAETVIGWVGVARSGSGLVTFGPFETEEEAETAAAPTAPDPLFLELLQEDPEDDHGSAAWSANKGWHDVTEPERAAMSASVARNIADKTGRVVYLNDPTI